MKKNIFLIGFMGTGKTTVSHQLAQLLCNKEVDLDWEIEAKENQTISSMFQEFGEEYFRDRESAVIREYEEKNGYVVSCGGGAVLRKDNVASMKKNGIIVLLTASPETIYERVKNQENRPLLKGNMNVEYITELMDRRAEVYAEAADITIATDGRSPLEISGEIVRKINI